jgi:hypothetical protein
LKRIVLVLSVMAVALALSAGVAMSQAATERSTEEIPVEATFTNPCTGEEMFFSYTIVHRQQTTTDANGGTHLISTNRVSAARGTGLSSGEEYILISASNPSTQDLAGGTRTMGNATTVNFISTGGGDNFQQRFTIHATMNANGEWTAEFANFSSECTG